MAQSLRVLVADDHVINRLVFREIFEHLGCAVEAVEDGERAIQTAAIGRFDLICLDRHMPGLTGDEVAVRLPMEQLVVVWSTDLVDLPVRFDGVLAKPLTVESAAKAIALATTRRNRAFRGHSPSGYALLRRRA